MKILKYLTFAFASLMFSCDSAEKEIVTPAQNSQASSERLATDPFPCSLTTSNVYGGAALVSALDQATGCRQPACLNTAEDLGSTNLDLYTTVNWTSEQFTPTQMQALIDKANNDAAAILNQISCTNSSNSKIYTIDFSYTGFGAARKIIAIANFYCCDGNVVYPD